jgi:hypothetical protein
MSDPSTRPALPPDPAPPDQRNGCLTAFMIIVGIILLLPGLCVILVSSVSRTDFASTPIGTLCLLIGAGGVSLIVWAIRRRTRSGRSDPPVP